MSIKILTKEYRDIKHYDTRQVENKGVNEKVRQSVKAYPGPVTEDRIPYFKAGYVKKKAGLLYNERRECNERLR